MSKKTRHITLIIISAVCLIALFCTVFFIFFKDDGQTRQHKIKNKLDESIDIVPFYSEGNLLAYKNGEIIMLAQNVYDKTATDPLYTADYALDKNGNILFVFDKKLYLNKDGKTTLLINNVIAWKISNDFSRVAFITNTLSSAEKGSLYLFVDDEVKILDTNVLASSMHFSTDGKTLYAQKANIYPKNRYMLLKYSDSLESIVVLEECDPIKLVLQDAVICGREVDELYQYTIYSSNFKKSVQVDKTFYPSISENGKYAFFIKNYTYPQECGTLVKIDLKNLKQTEIASQVSLFSCDVVTNSNEGIVYTRADGEETFSIFYKAFSSKEEVRLIRQTNESAIYNVAVNTKQNSAFLLTNAPRRIDNAIYYLDFSGNLKTTKIIDGYVDSLTYYEEFDKVTFVLEPETNSNVYLSDKNASITLLGENVANQYDNTLRKFSAKAVLLGDGQSSVIFKQTDKDPDICNMYLSKNGQEEVIAENVLTKEFFMPIIQADAKQIFYCVEENEKVNLYCYANGQTECITKEIDGIVDL